MASFQHLSFVLLSDVVSLKWRFKQVNLHEKQSLINCLLPYPRAVGQHLLPVNKVRDGESDIREGYQMKSSTTWQLAGALTEARTDLPKTAANKHKYRQYDVSNTATLFLQRMRIKQLMTTARRKRWHFQGNRAAHEVLEECDSKRSCEFYVLRKLAPWTPFWSHMFVVFITSKTI